MIMITEDYVSFETAKLIKKKGFDWPCHATYDTAVTGGKPKFSEYEVLSYFPYGMKNTDDKYGMIISAPTLQMAMKWLREVHNIDISVTPDRKAGYSVLIFKDKRLPFDTLDSYSIYEQACEAAIKYCLENLI